MAGVEVEGVNRFARVVREAPEALQEELKAAHLEGAQLVEAAARTRAPRGAGDKGKRAKRLVDTLHSSATLRKGVVKAGSKKVPYAGPIHFGWGRRGIRPQPFIYTALDTRRDEVLDRFLAGVETVAAGIAGEGDT